MGRQGEQWRERYAAILELLRTERIHSQGELLLRLRRRGFRVTQPSVSRDLAELHVAKVDGRYVAGESVGGSAPAPGSGPEGAAGRAAPLAEIARYLRRCVPAGPHLLVLQTPPGRAPLVALALDQCAWREIVGTIAGDDVVFVALAGRRQQARVAARLVPSIKEPAHA